MILQGRLIDFIHNRVAVIAAAAVAELSATIFWHQTVIRAWVQDYEIKVNSTTLKSGEESPPLEVGANKEKVEFEIDVSAAGHRPSIYFLSIYRGERFSFHPYYLYFSSFLFSSLPAKEFQISQISCNLKAAVVALTGYSEVEVRTAVCQVCPCPATNSGCILWRWMC